MSESVNILIKADDQASKQFVDISQSVDTYALQVEQLKRLHSEGAITAEEFAAATEKINNALKNSTNQFRAIGGQAKSATELVGTLASFTGNNQVAGFASQIASLTERVSQFSDVAKNGGIGAMAFKAGLVALVATIGAKIGQTLGDIIFKTERFNRELERAKETTKAFDAQMQKMQSRLFSTQQTDIELIRDPEQKQSAYGDLLEQLDKDIYSVSQQLARSTKVADEWAESWKITGNQKEFAQQAEEQLKTDQARLSALKDQRDAIVQLTSARAQERAEIAAANAAKDKSEEYIETLRREVEYLAATREEQIKLDAAKNATLEDRGEAERLLRERDAIHAKILAEEELEKTRKKAIEDAARDAKKAKEDAEREAVREQERIADLIKSEQQRLRVREIEIEKGKEAAKVQELINQGIDENTAKQLAAEERRLDGINAEKQKPDPLQATQGRLITRGSESSIMDETNKLLDMLQKQMGIVAGNAVDQLTEQRNIAKNTASTVIVRSVT